MSHFKHTLDPATFAQRELGVNCLAGFLAGVAAAAMTNAFEAITVAKQTRPDLNIMKLIKTERFRLLTKGVTARVYYNGAQSLLFFTLVLQIGKAYNVELNDD